MTPLDPRLRQLLCRPSQRMVVALGGNAISLPTEEGNIEQQFRHSRDTAACLAGLVEAGHQLTITHGNGPQVGNIMRRVELSLKEVYPIPLYLAVADTQAGMGFMLGQCLENEFAARGSARRVTTLVTSVAVDPADPDFAAPSKPIGSYMPRDMAEARTADFGWTVREVRPGQWRRVVPSPEPIEVREEALIKQFADAGELLIACGGGGIPVCRNEAGMWTGLDAVIDKDRASALLALTLEADLFVILTGVDRVCVNFEKPDQCELGAVGVAELRALQAEGQFPAGSMGPKIEAVCRFVERSRRPDALALITGMEHIDAALRGETGTVVHAG